MSETMVDKMLVGTGCLVDFIMTKRYMAVAAVVLLAACGQEKREVSPSGEQRSESPELVSKADSLAHHLVAAHGGLVAWPAVRYLRFDFGFETPDTTAVRARHLWDRQTGDYRLEWFAGADTTYTALFNVNTRDGVVFVNGNPAAAAREALLETAYSRFVNDTYWLLAPLKVFDEGVQRSIDPDSSTSGRDVLALSFDGVGLTPGDRYWLSPDSAGLLQRWSYILEGWNGRPASTFEWIDYQSFDTPAGVVRLATRKKRLGGSSAITTANISMPESVDRHVLADVTVAMD
ncbi:MAG: hypothetical protein KJO98_16240 [Rhodothermia bacterium]|nr:hypothetical protein [Rhodothermia bacterium]